MSTATTKGGQLLSKKAIRKAYWSWMFWNLSVQNFERMQGPAIVKMLADVREDLYPGDVEAQKEMLERHTIFFNTEPYLGCLVPGIVLGMEQEKAAGGDIAPEFINSIKTALMGPFAGIGDSLLPGTLCPILLSIAMGMCQNGELIGPLFYILVFLGVMLPLTWFLFSYGCRTGANAAQLVLAGGLKDRITKAAEIIGLMVVGAVTAAYVNVNIGLVYQQGDMTLNISSMVFDSLMPKLPVLLMAFLTYFLMAKKKWSVNKMMLLFLVMAVVGYFTTIFA